LKKYLQRERKKEKEREKEIYKHFYSDAELFSEITPTVCVLSDSAPFIKNVNDGYWPANDRNCARSRREAGEFRRN